jgi:hypothetical protein
MIERIPGKVAPSFIGLIRTSAGNSQPFRNTSCFRRLSPSPIRLYASPPTGDSRVRYPADPQFSQQGPHNPQSHELPRYFPPPEQQNLPPRPKRSLRPYIYATVFFLIGSAAGRFISLFICPPDPPLPGSAEDITSIAIIHKRAANLPIVQTLSNDPEWRSWYAYSKFTPEEKLHRITTGPLAGSRGLGGYQRVFCNAKTGEFITVVWIGGALSGWPQLTHGGLTATIMDENMGRCAIAKFPVQTGVTAYLNLTFLKPVKTHAFYVLRANPIAERSTERKGFVKGRLESIDGKGLVLAEGLFVLPKNVPQSALKPIELKNLDVGF